MNYAYSLQYRDDAGRRHCVEFDSSLTPSKLRVEIGRSRHTGSPLTVIDRDLGVTHTFRGEAVISVEAI
ncbi:hypothetical protein AB0F16_32165 [Streptomyces tanashiensis]|jgi:hypothetical protein|uniref:hypothetical protein n=1 Tax=Streptomyces tanashiensis TaxID=67367 RepID=UPI0033EDC6E8